MNISLSRLCHFWLAIVSGLFILIASITGAILSFEPIYIGSYDYYVDGSEQIPLVELIKTVKSVYPEIQSVSKDHNNYVAITAFIDDDESTFYIDPFTGAFLGDRINTPGIFDFCRTLHRSLFMGQVGRFIIGLSAVVLCFLVVSGITLLLKKLGGLFHFFDKVIDHEFNADYHSRLGRLFAIIVAVVSLSGGYLFLERFELIQYDEGQHTYDFETSEDVISRELYDFEIFQTATLEQLQQLTFPFSDFPDDFFELKLTDKELLVHQYSGEIMSRIEHQNLKKLSEFTFDIHTAQGQPIWAGVLGISSLSMLFFIYSGFRVSAKRTSNRAFLNNPLPPEKCEYFVFVGSETGNSLPYANALHHALTKSKKRSYVASMSAFVPYDNMQYVFVITSTYGTGGPPNNAAKFLEQVQFHREELSAVEFAVLGFGSLKYPDFCQYAIEVDDVLGGLMKRRILSLEKVDDGSKTKFDQWTHEIGEALDLDLNIELTRPKPSVTSIKLVEKKHSKADSGDTFMMRFKVTSAVLKTIESGDLLIYTPEDGINRYYSMSVDTDGVLLCVKRHDQGIVSMYFAQLEVKDQIDVAFMRNPHFHFPKHTTSAILISNGTGVAPFLGMLSGNVSKVPVSLYFGLRNSEAYKLFEPELDQLITDNKLASVKTAYSREHEEKIYVQDIVRDDRNRIGQIIAEGGVIMICGSLKMQVGVEEVLSDVVLSYTGKSLQTLKQEGVIRTDCY